MSEQEIGRQGSWEAFSLVDTESEAPGLTTQTFSVVSRTSRLRAEGRGQEWSLG